jgi:NAD(P)-dependent dehydrogenase (short-subunit alcohol dehydrogenase family)
VDADPTEASPLPHIVIVTGGSRGTGRAIARILAVRGYAVVINYAHHQAEADAAVDEILAMNRAAIAIRANVADELDVERLFNETIEAFCGVDVVVHAAGQLSLGPTPDDARDVFQSRNVHGAFLLRQEAARRLSDGGVLISFSGRWQPETPADVAALLAFLSAQPRSDQGRPRLEAVVLPVSDVDQAKHFYQRLGWRLDVDLATSEEFRVVQLTPPGSQASIIVGHGVTSGVPGSTESLILAVSDIDAARADLIDDGIAVSEVFHDDDDDDGGFDRAGTAGRLPGPDHDRRSHGSWASFTDPDGNGWVLRTIRRRVA